ncbi:hypothetical protein AYI69_g3330 [Smittium culicis]|uniref:Uncharacterized protein n=1 Tax=Smittium culicis TaxID=133412 RepID=A0A1R1YK25_9FUNG|nr:hypothetical protein AYI69_g3330 [Smittium culicis]
MIKLIKEQLLPLATIDDASAWAQKDINVFIPFGMNVLFRKSTPETVIPSFLVHPEGRIGLFYKGGSGSSPVAKPAEIVHIFGSSGVVDTEFGDEFKSMSKNYQKKQKIRTIKPSSTDPRAPLSSPYFSESDYFDEQDGELMKIKQESEYNRGFDVTKNNDGDV